MREREGERKRERERERIEGTRRSRNPRLLGRGYVGLERGEISDCPNGQGTDTRPAVLIGETTDNIQAGGQD